MAEALAGRAAALSAAETEVAEAGRPAPCRARRAASAGQARADGLALALDEESPSSDAGPLAGQPRRPGHAASTWSSVETGWEAPFEAAAGGALGAVVVDGVGAARALLARLAEAGTAAAVLRRAAGPSGETLPPDAGDTLRRARLRPTCSSTAGGRALARRCPGTAVAVDGGWEKALDVALANPALVVVTRDGDRFRPTGLAGRAPLGPGHDCGCLDEARAKAEAAEARWRWPRVATPPPPAGATRPPPRWPPRRPTVEVPRRRTPPPSLVWPGRRPPPTRPSPRRRCCAAHRRQLAELSTSEVGARRRAGRTWWLRLPARARRAQAGLRGGPSWRSRPERVRCGGWRNGSEAVHSLRTELEVLAARPGRAAHATSPGRRAEVDERLERAGGEREAGPGPGASTWSGRRNAPPGWRHWSAAQLASESTLPCSSRRAPAPPGRGRDRLTTRLDRGTRRRRSAAERRLEEVRERARRAELEEAERACAWRRRSRRCGATSTASPRRRWRATCPPLGRRHQCRRAGPASSSGSCG